MIEENKHIGFTKDGHLDENSIGECAEWLNDESKELHPDLQKHLSKCTKCKSEVLEVSELISDSSQGGSAMRDKFEETCAAKHSPSIKPARKFQVWQAAAIILVLVSITIAALLLRTDRTDTGFADKSLQDSLKDKTEEVIPDSSDTMDQDLPRIDSKIPREEVEKVAANFTPNPGLEALIGVKYRGQNEPRLTSPTTDTTLSQGELKFAGTNPGSEKLEIQLLDNKGEIVNSYPDIVDLEISIELPGKPGLYYWKLAGEDELYSVGKVTIK